MIEDGVLSAICCTVRAPSGESDCKSHDNDGIISAGVVFPQQKVGNEEI